MTSEPERAAADATRGRTVAGIVISGPLGRSHGLYRAEGRDWVFPIISLGIFGVGLSLVVWALTLGEGRDRPGSKNRRSNSAPPFSSLSTPSASLALQWEP